MHPSGISRDVPIPTHLARVLRSRRIRTGRRDGFVFPGVAASTFTPSNVRRRAAVAWATANKERAKRELEPLTPIGLHECRPQGRGAQEREKRERSHGCETATAKTM